MTTSKQPPTLKELLPLVRWNEHSIVFAKGDDVSENTPGCISGGLELFGIDDANLWDVMEDFDDAEIEEAAFDVCDEIISRVNSHDALVEAVKIAHAFFINPTSFNPLEVEQLYQKTLAMAEPTR